MRGGLGDKQRLLHILEAISEIEVYTHKADEKLFSDNSMMRFASIKQLEIIGEAANVVSEETKEEFSEIKWKEITGLRHILVHEYFGIDDHLIWQIIKDDIPLLRLKVENALKTIG
ncbi:MAG: DUF86 domain-containing protein [Chitinophagaceae bacterium]|nr:DUF86 domain-containing protein [Chitinophagaceae bacterium]